MQLSQHYKGLLDKAMERSGQRPTKQREHIFALLLDKRDHPTADEIYARARQGMPSISLATVYNCLEALTESKLIRQVNFERQPTRYCPNLRQHAHFHCQDSGEVIDIELSEKSIAQLMQALPKGFSASSIDITYNGRRNSNTKTTLQN